MDTTVSESGGAATITGTGGGQPRKDAPAVNAAAPARPGSAQTVASEVSVHAQPPGSQAAAAGTTTGIDAQVAGVVTATTVLTVA